MRRNGSVNKETSRKSILKEFYKARVDNALEEELTKDKAYLNARNDEESLLKRIEETGLDSRQWEAVDLALSAYNGRDSEYGRIAYCLGFKDAARLGMELFTEILD